MNKIQLKICGIRKIEDAKYCEMAKIDFVGLNFVPTSKRVIARNTAVKICKAVNNISKVGVFQNQPIEFVNATAQGLNLDYIQLAGNENLKYIKQCNRPVIKTISIRQRNDLNLLSHMQSQVSFFIIDGPNPGGGEIFNWDILENISVPFLLAGGINVNNVLSATKRSNSRGVDIASGVETDGEIDQNKIAEIRKILISTSKM